jgi:hypothetical protein
LIRRRPCVSPKQLAERRLPQRLRSPILAVTDEIINDGRVSESRDVAQIREIVFGDLAQNAAHDLAGAGLG